MSAPVRVSAVSFLNARPLVAGLAEAGALFDVRFDLPAACAERLHAGDVDLGLIPSFEYLRGDYRLVPDVAIGSDGPIESVAIFTTVPMARVRRLALDTSSRTSAALAAILCAKRWQVAPEMVPSAPSLAGMLATADAALIIGDPALAIDPVPAGVEKVDLGAAWRELTGLPFVYAAWTGRPGALDAAHLAALGAARDLGVRSLEAIAAEAAGGDPARARSNLSYLRHNLHYTFGPREQAGLERFHALAVEVHLGRRALPLRFY